MLWPAKAPPPHPDDFPRSDEVELFHVAEQQEPKRHARLPLLANPGHPEFVVTRDGKPVTTLHPQKRTYRVQTMPMTESGIHVKWNRDLFVAMGDDLGANTWSMRIQYKPMVRYIWLGALITALGGIVAITDRRYRRRRYTADDAVAAAGAATAR